MHSLSFRFSLSLRHCHFRFFIFTPLLLTPLADAISLAFTLPRRHAMMIADA
jgi:hypothetical protein